MHNTNTESDEKLARRLQQEEAFANRFKSEIKQKTESEDAELAAAIALSLEDQSKPSNNKESDDEKLARRLQQEEEAALAQHLQQQEKALAKHLEAKLSLQEKSDTSNDAELAAAIELSLRVSSTPAYNRVQQQKVSSTDPVTPLRSALAAPLRSSIPTHADIASLENPTTRIAAISLQAVDIHTHTGELGVLCKPFLAMDERYGLSFRDDIQSAFNRVRSEIEQRLAHESPADQATVRGVLGSIAARGPSVLEPETQLNSMSLLVKSWGLADKLGQDNLRQLIVDNLKHNIQAQGGCDAGIAARLVQPYTVLCMMHLKQASGLYHTTKITYSYQ